MWQLEKAIYSYCSNGFKKHLQIKERHHSNVFSVVFCEFFFLPLKFLLGHYGVGSGMNLCDSYEVSIKIVNSA